MTPGMVKVLLWAAIIIAIAHFGQINIAAVLQGLGHAWSTSGGSSP